ncbi:recombinase family protein [Lysinibacillus fusiformis]|nr:recombinase family protein [Lysinibacillus sphaericus]MDN4970960.1 recombinase family protein [Lysinibacillus fusiformis]
MYELTDRLKEKEVDFVSVHDSFDTSTPTGKAMFGILPVFAEFERDYYPTKNKGRLRSCS